MGLTWGPQSRVKGSVLNTAGRLGPSDETLEGAATVVEHYSDQHDYWKDGLPRATMLESLEPSTRNQGQGENAKAGSKDNAFSAVVYLVWKWVCIGYVLVSFPCSDGVTERSS